MSHEISPDYTDFELEYPEWAWTRNVPVEIREWLFADLRFFALVRDGPDFKYELGQHEEYFDDRVMGLLNAVGQDYGPCRADFDWTTGYGIRPGLWLTDVFVEDYGYLNTADVTTYANMYGFRRAPLLFSGPYAECLIQQFAWRQSVVAPESMNPEPFKRRRGIRVLTQVETTNPELAAYNPSARMERWVQNPEYSKYLKHLNTGGGECV